MNTHELTETLDTLFQELVGGAPGQAYVLNAGDPGLLRVLDDLTAHEASASQEGGATVAAHTAHLSYGLSLLNRWADGENPFNDTDWGAAWRIGAVDEDGWASLRSELREQTGRWGGVLRQARDVERIELNGMIASIAHIAYHLGAIRQIQPATRGPREGGGQNAS